MLKNVDTDVFNADAKVWMQEYKSRKMDLRLKKTCDKNTKKNEYAFQTLLIMAGQDSTIIRMDIEWTLHRPRQKSLISIV